MTWQRQDRSGADVDMSTTTPELVHTAETPLENGWSATTPEGDNIVLDSVRAMAAGYAELHEATGDRVFVCPDGELTMTDSGCPSPFGNLMYLLQPLDDRKALLAEALDGFYGQSEGGPFIVFSPWPTGDLREIGLAPVGHPPLMARWTPVSAPQTDLEVREVASKADLADFERTLIECYPVRELLPFVPGRFMRTGTLDTAWKLFVGYVDGDPVACAAAYPTTAATVVEMVATRAECRGRGYGAVITAAAADSNGSVPAVLIASDDGQGVYERLGFRRISRFTLWIGQRRNA